jgi:hypothetical protein
MADRQIELLSDSESTLRLLDRLLDELCEPAPAPAPRATPPAPDAADPLRALRAAVRSALEAVQPGAATPEPRAVAVLADFDAQLSTLIEVLEAPRG